MEEGEDSGGGGSERRGTRAGHNTRISPALNKSLVIQRLKCGDAFKIPYSTKSLISQIFHRL